MGKWIISSDYGTLACDEDDLIDTMREMVDLIEGALNAGDELFDKIEIKIEKEQ